ncbi:MAG: CNNM domain-containing protein [Pontiellaceae bacterium]|jgi:CBS domain containing-hemolysin-like protein|nr:CNNM domain-containing protein [Pontiellaceae bacterium]
MNGWLSIPVIALAFAGSMLFSGLETGGYLLNRIRLRVRVRQGNRPAVRLQESLHDAHRFIFTVLIGNNIANYLLSSEVTRLYSEAEVWNAQAAATLTLMLPLFLFGELIPKNIFRHRADTLMYRYSWFLYFAQRLFSPATAFLKALFNLLTGGRGRREERGGLSLSLQGFREYFSGDTRRNTLSAHQHGMIDNLVSMHRVPVRQIMKPPASMIQLSEKATVGQVLDLMRTGNTDQVAVCRGTARSIAGFINLFNLMDPALKPDDPIKPLLHKPIQVTDGMPLTRAFRVLRKRGGQMAAVVDRSSRIVGLLHLRDIAGYIVSED